MCMEIRLVRANVEDAKELHAMQIKAFKELLEKYQDFTYFYFICIGQQKAGAVRIVDKREAGNNKRISPLFILPEYQGLGVAQRAIRLCEEIYGDEEWELDTILQEPKNCYLYEKMGYRQTGEIERINEKLTLVFYKK